MEVMKPPLIYVQGRCYRVNNPEPDTSTATYTGVDWDDCPPNYAECSQDEPCDGEDEFEITVTDSGRYKTSFHVARIYHGSIVGSKGNTKRRIEDETRTIIKVPRNPQDCNILITGSSKRAVASARRRVQMIVWSFRRKISFTHFLSIPMVTPLVKENFIKFKQLVLQDCCSRGIDETIFQDPEQLHLTLCTLVLNDSFEREEAAKVLERCKQDVVDPLMEGNSILILLAGVEYMNDDPTEVDVLYAKVVSNKILNTLVDDVVDYCSNAGLLDKQFENVKLHATIMNTRFRKTSSEDYGKRKPRETFNAAPILEMFHNYEFGEVSINTIHLSTRYTKNKTDGYYQHTAKISLLFQDQSQ